MKIVNDKYIRLTESQLREIVKSEVEKKLSLITEYAIKRKEFKYNFWNLLEQIIQNWCLVRYCRIIDSDYNDCLNHWKGELIALMAKIARSDLKGNNSYESRLKALSEVVEDYEITQNKDVIKDIITEKFVSEGIACFGDVFECVSDSCSESLNDVIDAIARKATRDYVMSL